MNTYQISECNIENVKPTFMKIKEASTPTSSTEEELSEPKITKRIFTNVVQGKQLF